MGRKETFIETAVNYTLELDVKFYVIENVAERSPW